MPKYDKNGKKPKGRQMKPADRSCAGACQYKVVEEVVDKKRVKEKDVFDKGGKKENKKKST
jgi:hypothetical protein